MEEGAIRCDLLAQPPVHAESDEMEEEDFMKLLKEIKVLVLALCARCQLISNVSQDPATDFAECGILESITLENFLCHAKFTMDFNPNITFIVGEVRSDFCFSLLC